ncbi:MAG: DnaJ domain-containing protein [Rhodospirillaceae bacterium]
MKGVGDPKGYYRILDVPRTATEATIKKAYRKRALELHPDRNKSPNAVAEFQILADAYQTLSDPVARRSYDHAASAQAQGTGATAAQQNGRAKSRRNAQSGRAETDRAGRSRSQNTANGSRSQDKATAGGKTREQQRGFGGHQAQNPSAAEDPQPRGPHACSVCGTLTAQPRFVILERVTGRLWKSVREPISGIMCRNCTAKLALAASLHSWIKGWWSIPYGPVHTMVALVTNLKGGIRPAGRNATLLLHQARAFLSRGDQTLARGLAQHANSLAPKGGMEAQDASKLLNSLGTEDGKRLRNVWSGTPPAFWRQLGPFFVAGLLGFLVLSPWFRSDPIGDGNGTRTIKVLSEPAPSTAGPRANAPPPVGAAEQQTREQPKTGDLNGEAPAVPETARMFRIGIPGLPLRAGPNANSGILSILDLNTPVILLEGDDQNGWLKVMTTQGLTGFVPATLLRPVPGLAPIDQQ